MGDVRALYTRSPAPKRPVVSFDECGKEPRGHVAEAVPPDPGAPAKADYESTVAAWAARNKAGAKIDWTFRVADARAKLDHRYP